MEDSHISRRAVLRLSGLGIVGVTGCTAIGDQRATEADRTRTPSETPRRTTDRASPTEQAATEEPTPEESTAEEESRRSPADLCRAVDPTIEGSDSLMVEFDSRQQRRCAGRPLDAFEDLSTWDVLEGTASADTETYFSGSQSARIEAGSSGSVVLTGRFDDPIDLSDRDVSVAVKLEEPRTAWLRIRLLAPDRANSMSLSRYFGSDTWLRLDLGPESVEGSPDLAAVRGLRVEVDPMGGTLRACLDSIRTTPRPERGSVLLTFDDNLRSQYETAFPITQEYDMPGVVGVIDSAVGSESNIPLEGMHEMQAAGWEMVSHPHTSQPGDLLELSEDDRRAELRANKQWLIDNGFERGARFIIWPFNAYDASSLELASKYHSLGFSLSDTPVGHRPTDPMIIGRVQGDDPDLATRMVDLAAQYNQLVVLMYHGIGTDDRISTSDFERVVSHVDSADVDVITASDLWGSLQS